MSEGIRFGVNWTRANFRGERPDHQVLPSLGCGPAARGAQVSSRSSARSCPTTTWYSAVRRSSTQPTKRLHALAR